MTAPLLRRHTDAADAAQRFAADEASREVAQLDPRTVLLAIQVKLAEGRVDEAKAMADAFKKASK
jgi:hypothetical protein